MFNQFGDLERCALRPGNVHSADGWEDVLRPVLARYSSDTRPSIKREYVQVLRLLETFDLEVLHGAVKDALRLGAIGYDAVKHLVLCRIERRPPKLDLDIYP